MDACRRKTVGRRGVLMLCHLDRAPNDLLGADAMLLLCKDGAQILGDEEVDESF